MGVAKRDHAAAHTPAKDESGYVDRISPSPVTPGLEASHPDDHGPMHTKTSRDYKSTAIETPHAANDADGAGVAW